jgi:hypothetical protein
MCYHEVLTCTRHICFATDEGELDSRPVARLADHIRPVAVPPAMLSAQAEVCSQLYYKNLCKSRSYHRDFVNARGCV